MQTELFIRTKDQDFTKEPASIYVYDKIGENEECAWEYAIEKAEQNFGEVEKDFTIEWTGYDSYTQKHIFNIMV